MAEYQKPDFFIVGAPKCGTTSLYYYLRQHPQIFMPDYKEPHYFGKDLNKRSDKFINNELDSSFRRNGFGEGCLNLLRQKPSKCPICKDKKGGKKVHDNENSYVIKTKDGLYYICRRASSSERIKIGSEHEEDWTFEYKPRETEENSNPDESEKLRLLKKIKNYFSFD